MSDTGWAPSRSPRHAGRSNRNHVLVCQHHAVERFGSHANGEFFSDMFDELDVPLVGAGNTSLTTPVHVGTQFCNLAGQGDRDDGG